MSLILSWLEESHIFYKQLANAVGYWLFCREHSVGSTSELTGAAVQGQSRFALWGWGRILTSQGEIFQNAEVVSQRYVSWGAIEKPRVERHSYLEEMMSAEVRCGQVTDVPCWLPQ